MQKPQTKDEIEQQLTSALKMVIDSLSDLGFEDFYILGKVNLILQDFINIEGDFTDEYKALALQAIDMRASQAFKDAVLPEDKPETVNLILPKGIGGGL
jgi:threonyl-tRNA synthetase